MAVPAEEASETPPNTGDEAMGMEENENPDDTHVSPLMWENANTLI